MSKKLPGVFANSINKQINNNEKVFTSNSVVSDEVVESFKSNPLYEKSIKQKIDEIFKSRKYIYKVPVKITTSDGVLVKYVIGRNSNNLITIDNELIAIDDILDISISDSDSDS
ncbi:MAG: hypothetical protein J6D28_03265 [Bacilli bacterium]|nr:hypothetical protein [Bacilli bacterium]